MPNYWVVGAMWGGKEDMLEKFLRGGYWYLGYTPQESAVQNSLRDQMEIGDRLAVKKMLGQGSPLIEIRALGIIKHIDDEDGYRRVYVDWVVERLSRQVPGKGCFGSVHGPFAGSDPWTREVFCL